MRIVGAVVLAAALLCAWFYAVERLVYRSGGGVDVYETAEFMRWAGGAALIGLAARIAGKWRWAVGVPMLLLLGGAGLCVYGLLLLGPGSAPGLVPGLLCGMLIIGPAIMAIPVVAPSSAAEPPSRRWHYRELWIWVGGVAALVVPLLSYGGPPTLLDWRLVQVRRDALAAVEDLVRTDVLSHSGRVVWEKVQYGRWPDAPGFDAQGLIPDTKVALHFRSPQLMRQSGRTGKAEGLRVDGLFISVPQPRFLSHEEASNLQVVKPFLLSMGLKPELVSRLSPGMAATYRGVTYLFRFNNAGGGGYPNPYLARPNRWRPTGMGVVIECEGVRSAASP